MTGVARRALVNGLPYGRCGRRGRRAFGGLASCAQRGAAISWGHRAGSVDRVTPLSICSGIQSVTSGSGPSNGPPMSVA